MAEPNEPVEVKLHPGSDPAALTALYIYSHLTQDTALHQILDSLVRTGLGPRDAGFDSGLFGKGEAIEARLRFVERYSDMALVGWFARRLTDEELTERDAELREVG